MRNTINNFIFGNRYDWSNPFTIVIDTRNTKAGGSAANEFLFPQNSDILDTYIDFLVDWGDAKFSRITSKAEAVIPHLYSTPGIYTLNFYKQKTTRALQLSPRYENFPNEANKLLKVLRWGRFNNSRSCFANCVNLDMSEVDGLIDFNGTGETNFKGCSSLTTFKGLNNISFNHSFTRIFDSCSNFNQECVLNVPNTTGVGSTMNGCTKFNSKLTLNAPIANNFSTFFQNCTSLNVLPILNCPNASVLSGMFRNCTAFNKDISNMLDWSKVTQMDNFMTGKTSSNYNAAYYDSLLIALDNAGRSNVPLGMGSIKHTSVGLTAKNNLIAKGWIITDGGII